MAVRAGRASQASSVVVEPSSDVSSLRRWMARHRWWLVALVALGVSHVVSTGVLALEARHAHLPIASSHSVFAYADSAWYLSAAIHGYAAHVDVAVKNTTGFFPAFPMAIRLVHTVLPLPWVVIGVLVDSLFEVGAVLAVAAVARQVLDERSAERGVVLFALFPGAYIFTEIYSEPLFLLAAALCLYGLYRRWWIVAGLAAALAGATRPTGIILAVCCAFVALREIRARRAWSSLLAPVLAPTGFVAFLVFLWIRTGSALTYAHTQDVAFSQRPSLTAIPNQIRNAIEGTPRRDAVYIIMLVVGIVGVVLLVRLRPRVPTEWLIYSALSIAVNLPSAHVGYRPRFALLTFPAIIGLGPRLRGRVLVLAVVVEVIGLAILSWTLPRYVP